MKRILLTTIALLSLCMGASAQDTWFCGEVGSKLSYVKKDAKNGTEVQYDYIIKDKTVADGRTTITFDVVIPGQQSTNGCKVWTDGKLFHNDASAALGQFGEGVVATGNSPLLPESPQLGDTLEDSAISIDALMLTSEYKKVKITANEDVTVPAGTFRCWCLEYDVVDSVMGLKGRSHVQQWIAKGVGDVKVVTKGQGGRLVSEVVLNKISK